LSFFCSGHKSINFDAFHKETRETSETSIEKDCRKKKGMFQNEGVSE
jgi:hypothetical protein